MIGRLWLGSPCFDGTRGIYIMLTIGLSSRTPVVTHGGRGAMGSLLGCSARLVQLR